MSDAVIVALIASGLTLAGTVITVLANGKAQKDALAAKINTQLSVYSAATDVKIDELTREVREHNGFARRLPVVEEKIDNPTGRVTKLEDKQ